MRTVLRRLAVAILVLCWQGPAAQADTAAGLAAYEGGDYEAARRLLKPEAENGDPEAQVKYGLILAKGLGTERDPAAAFKWFQKAADQGNVEAFYCMGVAYDVGDAGKQDFRSAAEWYRKAAERGFAKAEFNLGHMYLRGQGVDQEILAGRFWILRAAEHGSEDAAAVRGKLKALFDDLESHGVPRTGGGDGWSFERAITLTDAKTEMQGVDAEHKLFQSLFQGWSWDMQSVVNHDGRAYDIIDVSRGAERRRLYFDITEWFGHLE